jgi:hypothetical protein
VWSGSCYERCRRHQLSARPVRRNARWLGAGLRAPAAHGSRSVRAAAVFRSAVQKRGPSLHQGAQRWRPRRKRHQQTGRRSFGGGALFCALLPNQRACPACANPNAHRQTFIECLMELSTPARRSRGCSAQPSAAAVFPPAGRYLERAVPSGRTWRVISAQCSRRQSTMAIYASRIQSPGLILNSSFGFWLLATRHLRRADSAGFASLGVNPVDHTFYRFATILQAPDRPEHADRRPSSRAASGGCRRCACRKSDR